MSVSVTLDTTVLGDPIWTTSRGHTLTHAEARFTACDAQVTPILINPGGCPGTLADLIAAATGTGPVGSPAGSPAAGSATAAHFGGPGKVRGTRPGWDRPRWAGWGANGDAPDLLLVGGLRVVGQQRGGQRAAGPAELDPLLRLPAACRMA